MDSKSHVIRTAALPAFGRSGRGIGLRLTYTLGCALYTFAAGSGEPVAAATLPVPCIAGTCGSNAPVWVTSGAATAAQAGNTLTINQTTQNVLLNWQSFNISKDGTVTFVQPNATSIAVNKIFQANPAQIFGNLNANGQIYLINQNGILFGAGAQINVGGLVASTLNITPLALTNGIVQTNVNDRGVSSFVPFTTTDGNGVTTTQSSGNVVVDQGATVNAPGGQILMFAPQVENRGTLNTPDGQTILAAGSTVYLASSNDTNVRGLVVRVDAGGTVTNGTTDNQQVTDPTKLVGQILADHGNVTLMGLAVNQLGRVSASTSVRANGTIKLIAADSSHGGTLQIGANSSTVAPLDIADTSLSVDTTPQLKSRIDLQGGDITVASGAHIVAPSGAVNINATELGSGGSDSPLSQTTGSPDGSRLYIESGVTIDVSGANANLPMESNVLEVELRGSELADDPLQRNGVLRGTTVYVDTRQYGSLDGTTWVGTPLADLAGDLGTIQRGILERNVTGGSVTLQSQGDAIVASGAKVNVSGGSIQYSSGYLRTSSLLGTDGKVYSIADASPDQTYTGIASSTSLTLKDPRWGVTKTYNGYFGTGQGQYQAGYIQGEDAGSLTVNAPHVIFDAGLVANVVAGPFQRQPTASLTLSDGSNYRPFDTLPLMGGLQFGAVNVIQTPPDNVLAGVVFDRTPVLPTLTNADGTPFNPLTDPWPVSLDRAHLNPGLVGTGAAGRLTLFANGTISLPADLGLELPAGGSFKATAGAIDIAGTIVGAGATVNLQSVSSTLTTLPGEGGIKIAGSAVIDVAGAWINDSPTVAPVPSTAPLMINGGNVTIAATDGDVTLASGAIIDVSGGAQVPTSGAIVAGKAGNISVSAATGALTTPSQLTLGATLRGYGLTNGGALSLASGSFCIAQSGSCGSTPVPGEVDLTPDFFTAGGFSSFSLAGDFAGLTVAAQTNLRPEQQNFLATSALLQHPSAATLSSFATLGTLDDLHRSPVSLALSAAYVPPSGSGNVITTEQFATASSLTLGAGSTIVLDPGASVSLKSNTRIVDDGLVSAPGGSVTMTLTNTLDESDFIAGHKIWLGSDATVDVSGTVRAGPDGLGNIVGDVLAGGTVTFDAQRGAVETLAGSMIDVSGTSATLNVRQTNAAGVSTYPARSVSSAAGSVSVTAAEAILLGGAMRAKSGDPGHVANGTLSVTLDGNNRYSLQNFGSSIPPDPFSTPVIEVAESQAPVAIGANADLPATYDGRALLSASALRSAGFDALNLQARSLSLFASLGAQTQQPGEIRFVGDVALTLGRQLTLDAANFTSDGNNAVLSAPYISIGQSTVATQGLLPPSQTGSGTLTLQGALIDVIGSSVANLAQLTLDSTGDIRGIGVRQPFDGTAVQYAPGALTTSGAVTITAQQVYPSTLTQFTFASGAGGTGDLTIAAAPGIAAGPLLSAGGDLIFSAPDITQAGVVRAPFGTIEMSTTAANGTITLAPGSTTSTSAEGATIPFGATQGGFDWVYPTDTGGDVTLYGVKGQSVPAQSIQLTADAVQVKKGAVIDASGGGDLLATEFVPGPTGTQDVLASSTAFAIIPTSSLQFAPYDPYYASSSGVGKTQSVYLSGGSGIPAGTYAVLPARYALLPGAYYVTAVAGYDDLSPGQQIKQADGSTIVSGYDMFAGTGLGAPRTSGFDIQSGKAVQNLAQYTLTSADTFFATQANAANVAATRLPLDAGTIVLSATTALTLDGILKAAAADGGRGVALDITSAAIRVVDGTAPPAPLANTLDVDANALSSLGAESILLGGTRTASSAGLEITTKSSTVEVASGAQLSIPELLLVGTQQVEVDSGATVAATGKLPVTDAKILMSGDGALLRVATAGDPLVSRTGATPGSTQGQVQIDSGARIRAINGSMSVESSAGATLAGNLQLTGGSLSITGSEISLGDAPAGVTGTVVSLDLLNGLSVANLSLNSRGGIDFYGDLSLSGQNVTLNATALQGLGTGNAQLTASDTLTLADANTAATPSGVCITQAGCNGTLRLQGGTVVLDNGDVDIAGFSTTTVTALGTATASGKGSLTVAGNLNVEAGLLTADTGAQRTLNVGGGFTYEALSGAAIPAPAEDPLGASLSINAQSIAFDGSARLRSGLLTLTATGPAGSGDIVLGSHAAIDLSGVNTVFDSVVVPSRAGALSAQSQQGSVTAAAGSQINVNAVDGAPENAGGISVQAANGTIDLEGGLLGRGAAFNADALAFGPSLGSFAALETSLGSGGFAGARSIRLRGPGDLVVGASSAESITASSVSLTADQGQVVVDGTITSHAASGGAITLAASGNVLVNGTLDARSTSSSEQNGHIELDTENAAVLLGSGATLAAYDASVPVQAVSDGGLLIRAPQATLASLALAGNLQSLRSLTIEGFLAYQNTTGTITDADVAVMQADAQRFMGNAPNTLNMLGGAAHPTWQIVPGVEIDYNAQAANAPTALTLQSDLLLDSWTFPSASGAVNVAGELTIRSSGDILFNHSLSDGFAGNSSLLAAGGTASWSYRLAAGADLGSANPLAVQPTYNTTGGSLIVAPDPTGNSASTMIRTGTGNISVAAAANVQLMDATDVIYTAGSAGPGTAFTKQGQLAVSNVGLAFPTQGGNIAIAAGGDVIGAPNDTELVTDWMYRIGSTTGTGVPTAWTINFANFRQGIGALAGGNVAVTAGGDLLDVSVNTPTVGRQSGPVTGNNPVEIVNSGNIFMSAGGDVAGGTVYAGRGSALVLAGNQIKDSTDQPGLYPVIAIGDANVTLVARAGATLASVLNPTLLPLSLLQSTRTGSASFFSTYTDNSAVTLRTAAADAELLNQTANSAIATKYSSLRFGDVSDDSLGSDTGISALRIYPGTVDVAALRGGVQVDYSMTLYPDPHGNLSLFAHDSVNLGTTDHEFTLLESDADPALLPTLAKPQTAYSALSNLLWGPLSTSFGIDQNAPVPVHLSADTPDTVPSRIVALTGDVAFDTSAGGSELYFAEPARIIAGRDVSQLDVDFQNLSATSVSAVIAGRDITYPLNRGPDGKISTTGFGDIFVDGPGTLDVWAGRSLNLQTSNGITSRGNSVNPVLPAGGADVSVETGVGASGTPDFTTFIGDYLTSASIYAPDLVTYMQPRMGGTPTFAAALTAFEALPTTDQAPLIETIFFDELRASGRSAAQAGTTLNDFTRGFAAITALFPGGNPDPAQNQTNPYSGDLSLYFSRIYTLDGGDIRLVAPGGEINAGLAAAPSSFGVNKNPDQLGIVAETTGNIDAYSFGDFAVNQSRVFAADGGNILIWSTRGDIDAGRGSKTAISAPPPTITFDNGVPVTIIPPAIAGSGIQSLATTDGVKPGDVDLFAPHGVVNADDAGIVAGNLTIAATAVLGADNIKVSGVAVGLPPDTSGLGASLSAVSSVGSSASQAATQGFEEGSKRTAAATVADTALGWLDAFVEGFGEEVCKAADLECLKRQKNTQSP